MGIEARGTEPEQAAFELLFPFKDPFKRLQALSEKAPKSRGIFSVLDMIRKEYKSDTLKSFMESYNIEGIPLDRKGRLEVAEIAAARRLSEEEREAGLT